MGVETTDTAVRYAGLFICCRVRRRAPCEAWSRHPWWVFGRLSRVQFATHYYISSAAVCARPTKDLRDLDPPHE